MSNIEYGYEVFPSRGESPNANKPIAIEMTLSGVLLAARWRNKDELTRMPDEDKRNTLIVELTKHTNQPVPYFQGFDSNALVAKGAVVVLLRDEGIRDVAALKTMSDDDQRNTLIVEINKRTGAFIQSLQAMNNQALVQTYAADQARGGRLADSDDSPFSNKGEARNAQWLSQLTDRYTHTWLQDTIPMAANPPDDRSEGSLLVGRDDTSYTVRRNLDPMMAKLAIDYAAWTIDAFHLSSKFFKALPTPAAADPKLYKDDRYFAATQLAGPDPMMIERVRNANELPESLRTAEQQAELIRLNRIPHDFQNALNEGRLYRTDFTRYDAIRPKDGVQRYTSWPCAVFIAGKGTKNNISYHSFLPVSISLNRPPQPDGLRFQATTFAMNNDDAKTQWTWETAKRLFLSAAANYHELGSHLGRTHLVMERYALATYRQLPPWHPVGRLLRPHFKFLVATNHDAVQNLVNPGGPVDLNFFTNADEMLKITKDVFETWDLRKHGSIEADLHARGLDDPNLLPFFPYRDQGIPVYRAIKSFVRSYLRLWYADDKSVLADKALWRWNDALRTIYHATPAAIPLMTAPWIEELITACTNIIWTSGPQHSAVNYTQYAFLADANTVPFGIHKAEAVNMDKQQATLFETPHDSVRDQAAVITRLAAFRYDALGDYKSAHDHLTEYGDLGDPNKPWAGVVNAFKSALREVGDKMQGPRPAVSGAQAALEREFNPRWDYDYLHPDKITNGISI